MVITEVRKGLWKHNENERSCQVIGNARIAPNPIDLVEAHLEGIAFHRIGYKEKSKESNSVQVYTDRSSGKPILRYLKMGQFESPESVVIYRESTEEQGQNQLFWESPETFGINFTPINL